MSIFGSSLLSTNNRNNSTQNEIFTLMRVKINFLSINHTGETELMPVNIVYIWYIYEKYVQMLMNIRLRLTHQQN